MNYCLIVFASATTANRVKSVLMKKFHIESEVVQTPQGLPAEGCSYSIRIKKDYAETAWNLIKESGLSSKGIFTEYDYIKLNRG